MDAMRAPHAAILNEMMQAAAHRVMIAGFTKDRPVAGTQSVRCIPMKITAEILILTALPQVRHSLAENIVLRRPIQSVAADRHRLRSEERVIREDLRAVMLRQYDRPPLREIPPRGNPEARVPKIPQAAAAPNAAADLQDNIS